MSTSLLFTALSLGLLSSFHCVGMCGAIALSIPTQQLKQKEKLTGIMLYNAGRIITYTLLGLLFGVVGRTIYLGGVQQWFSILAGLAILWTLGQRSIGLPVFRWQAFEKMLSYNRRWMGILLRSEHVWSVFLLGMANGILPCGLVYLAITGALSVGSISGGAVFMIAFGAGTIPAMFLLSYFGFLIRVSMRNRIQRTVPYFIAAMALLLIARGMGLAIPYISPSPAHHTQNAILCP